MLNVERTESVQPQSERPHRSRDILDFISLKTASGEDQEAIGELLVRTFMQTYARKLPHVCTPEERIKELRNVALRQHDGDVLILELGYRIIGTAALIRPGASSSESWLENSSNLRCVAIDPEFQGLGFAEVLLGEAEALARRWNSSNVCLHVQSGAEGVARMYLRWGFTRAPVGDIICHGHRVDGYVLDLIGRDVRNQPQ